MKNRAVEMVQAALVLSLILVVPLGLVERAAAQNPELPQRVAEIKQAMAQNKQALAQYTWVEQVGIILKGEQKKQERFQVRLGPDGKPQKQSLDPSGEPPEREGRLKKHVVEKKTEEYKDYAEQMKALIHQYVPPDKDMIEQAYSKGNISLGPAAGAPNEVRLVFSNYIKQGDNMTLVVDKAQKQLLSVSINSYIDDPSDAVNVTVQFAQMPGGPNHISAETINGVKKQLTIQIQNSNYQHL